MDYFIITKEADYNKLYVTNECKSLVMLFEGLNYTVNTIWLNSNLKLSKTQVKHNLRERLLSNF